MAMCDRPAEDADMRQFVHMVVPLGLQPYKRDQSRNVALVLSKALDYANVAQLFTEDAQDPQTARDSLHLLEMIMLMLEQWVQSLDTAYEDEYMFGLTVSLIEVLVHAAAFWARLKQSEVLTSMVLKM